MLSLAVSAIGTLYLLRDQQQEAAEERVGRLAEPLTLAVALLEESGATPPQIQNAVADYAGSFDVRVLLVTQEGRVVLDTDSRLTGHTVEWVTEPDTPVTKRGGSEFRMGGYASGEDDLLVFAPAHEALELSPNRLVQLQTLTYSFFASSAPL
ncbi:MAG: hypothetical protein Q8S13_02030, partial [Dehalococcoidia bacterium]|nr:hypothetical protein [Dehalococcoidia bacterium]